MVKSSIKKQRVVSSKPISHNKKTTKQIIENKIKNYTKKTHQPLVSRIRLFEELNKIHKNKSHNQIKFYLKQTLLKLLNERVLVKHRDSYRFSKSYLNKQAKILLKQKKKQKEIKQKKSIKKELCKNIKAKIIKITSENSTDLTKSIETVKSKIEKKLAKIPNIKKVTIQTKSNNITSAIGNIFGFSNIINSTTTNQSNKSNKKDYKKIYPAIWQYYDNNKSISHPSVDGWYDYDAEASDTVEDAWQRYVVHRGLNDVRSVKSGEWEYMVDFMNWKQTNIIHSAHTKRNIRRVNEKGNITKNPYQ